ncbi:MAG: hypothetical protein U0176_04580 [Bacteroidia bacterium]
MSLNAYAGKVVQLRFRGVMGVVNRSDIALDHPRLTGTAQGCTGATQTQEEQMSLCCESQPGAATPLTSPPPLRLDQQLSL